MNFSYNVNELFKQEITVIDNVLDFCRKCVPDNSYSGYRERFGQLQNKVYEIVDKMGQASAKAQGLHSAITSGRKLTLSGHRLYIMKDSSDRSGCGSIVAILKVGTKKLFVYDRAKVQHEIEPLCVLDFYVHESRQRMGSGRKLFDFMLEKEHTLAQHLAIDRPSAKLLSFMEKHYRLSVLIPQVYNFVVFEGFFYNRSGWASRSAHQTDKDTTKSDLNQWTRPGSLRQKQSYMGASQWMYSRHGAISGAYCHDRPVSTRSCYRLDPWSNEHRDATDHKCSQPDLLSPKHVSQTPTGYTISTSSNPQSSTRLPDLGDHTRSGVSSPVVINVNYLPHTQQATPPFHLSKAATNQKSNQRLPPVLPFGVSHQPASWTQDYPINKTGLNQDLLQQRRPFNSIQEMRDRSQAYHETNEQQSVRAQNSTTSTSNTFSLHKAAPVSFDHQGIEYTDNKSSNHHSWTVTGVLLNQQLNTRAHQQLN